MMYMVHLDLVLCVGRWVRGAGVGVVLSFIKINCIFLHIIV